ncbi:MAG: DUF1127 domain-containing protein [Alphaproteobacteria bacterium]|jgi:uncharacterized protein YjiS (DUF1127 family)|nr:DUF1127 domain-containing protein [Alphaproteobacteria bacterium]|tara:strand:- start:218 stop:565 length:348 start_codon:yes stop_codon:yes gene_type:complete
MYQGSKAPMAGYQNGTIPMTQAADHDISSAVEREHMPRFAVLRSIAAAVGAALRRTTVERPRQRRRRKQRYAELAGFDDRMLKDIGLARGDLRYVAVRGIDPRPRRTADFRSKYV